MKPHQVVAEFVALCIVEHSYTPEVVITVEVAGSRAVITDTGRGMQLAPDPGDTISHAQRALTSIYPIEAGRDDVAAALTDLVWKEGGSQGPAPANQACKALTFVSRRDGETWTQHYRLGVPQGPATQEPVPGGAETRGTTIELETSEPIDGVALRDLIDKLCDRLPDLRLGLHVG